MNKEIHMFDLDGTLWNIKSEIWLIDKENPQRPIVKIDSLEFSMIKNGMFRKDDIPIDYNGQKFYISKKIYNKVYKRKGFENLDRLGISFIDFYDKEKLNKADKDFIVDNISHLRGKKVHVGLLTARSSQRTHSDIVNELRLELKNMNIPLNKIYFIGDKFKVTHDDIMSLKKAHILLEHLIGFKIKDNKFIPIRQDWYDNVHFYDDNYTNINYANDLQKIFEDVLTNTDDDLFKIILERVDSEELILINHLVSNNEIKRFKDTKIVLKEPGKFPIQLESFSSYSGIILEEVNSNKYYKVVTKDLKSLGLRNNPTIMDFPVGDWVYEPNPTEGPGGWGGTGGIWVANGLSQGKGLLKYMQKKALKENDEELKDCRLFEVEIGNVLYSNSYRSKVDAVKMIKEL
jgi:hypothetical protein